MDFLDVLNNVLIHNETKKETPIEKQNIQPDEDEKHLCYKYNITPVDLAIVKDHLNLGIEKKQPDKLKHVKKVKPDKILENYLNTLIKDESRKA